MIGINIHVQTHDELISECRQDIIRAWSENRIIKWDKDDDGGMLLYTKAYAPDLIFRISLSTIKEILGKSKRSALLI